MGKVKINGEDFERQLDAEHELPPADDSTTVSAPDITALEAELRRVQAERDMVIDRLARAQAEFENARKRAAREQQDYREYALADLIKQLLPIVDNFDRALKTGTEAGEFRSGVELINKQLHDVLGKMGVTAIAAEGAPFDPNVHEAIELVESEDAEDNHVLQELQRGYMLRGRLLRPAMVRVARNPKK